MNAEQRHALERLANKRSTIAIVLTAAMMTVYFGFILLIAFNKPLMSSLMTAGLSIGIFAGAMVIVSAWVLTYVYVRWANTVYDVELEKFSAIKSTTPTTKTELVA